MPSTGGAMADRINMTFGADNSAVIRSTDEIDDALRGTEDALRDVGSEGSDAADGLTDSLEDVRREAERTGENASDDLGEIGDAAGDVSGSLDGIGEAAKGALEGDLSGAVGVSVGALGTLLGASTSIGLLAGDAIGGVAKAVFDSVTQAAEAAKKRVEDALAAMIAAGNGMISQEFITEKIAEILQDETLVAEAKKWAESINVPVSTIVSALAGVPESIEAVTAAVKKANDESHAAEAENPTGRFGATYQEIQLRKRLTDQIEDQSGAIVTATGLYEIYKEASSDATSSIDLATQATEKWGTSVGKLPETVEISTSLNLPDMDSVFAGLQAKAKAKPIRFPAYVDPLIQYGGRLP